MQSKVKIALIGAGSMGRQHIQDLLKTPSADFTCIADTDSAARNHAETFGLKTYENHLQLMDIEKPQAVLIAAPHGDHPVMASDAFSRGIHVLSEKPAGVHAAEVEDAVSNWQNALKSKPDLRYAVMFQQRTYGYWKKIKEIIDAGGLGKLQRTTWIITDWFRTQIYFDGGGWRATWKGEGGGVLLNQCPHNLDLYQWFAGIPQKVTGCAALGKYHNIEVEDEVSAVFEHENGMIGHFITSTSESPGSNRLEIIGEKGKLVFEDGQLTMWQNQVSSLDLIKSSLKPFDQAPYEKKVIEYQHHGEAGHRIVIENFIEAVLNPDRELVCEIGSALASLKMANAIMLSALDGGRKVVLEDEVRTWKQKLDELISRSKFKKEVRIRSSDLSGSF